MIILSHEVNASHVLGIWGMSCCVWNRGCKVKNNFIFQKKLGLVEADVNQRASRFASFINMALLGLIAYLVLSYC